MGQGRLYTGTSGFAYKEWIGPFYPEGTKSAGMLRYYAERLECVEINYTFRRLPAASTLAGWRDQTPEGFVFACKANQGITHHARLVDAGERLTRFLEAVVPLGERLGPVLFQCPPNLRYDAAVLDGFLAVLGACSPRPTESSGPPGTTRGLRFAIEFRHPSFDTPEVHEKLAASGVAWCAADTEEKPSGFVRTAPDFAYIRLRAGGYDEAGIARWAAAIRGALDDGADVFAFFKHEEQATGPRDAQALRALVRRPA